MILLCKSCSIKSDGLNPMPISSKFQAKYSIIYGLLMQNLMCFDFLFGELG